MNKIFRSSGLGSVAVLAGGGASALLLALTAGPGSATTTLTVDTLTDGVATASDCLTPVTDSCSLRDAIAAAADGDVIVFEAGLAGTMTLTNDELAITVGLTITGTGSDQITIDADGNSRVFYLVSSAGDVTITGLTVTGGNGATGGGIDAYNAGSLDLVDVDVTGNSAFYAAGVYVYGQGSFSMTDSTVSNNTSNVSCGGLYFGSQITNVIITDSAITGNTAGYSGGGIKANNLGDVTLIDSEVTGNISLGYGGGGYLAQSGNLLVDGSVFADNDSRYGGGGIYGSNGGSVNITDSTFSRNAASGTHAYGGALYLSMQDQQITISNSTFDSNSAMKGGALDFTNTGQVVAINNSTIVGNSATSATGGGVDKNRGGSLTINQSTITENDAPTGGGIFLVGDGGGNVAASLLLSGSIVSANTSTNLDGADISLTWTDGDSVSSDHSLLGDIGDGIVMTDLGGTITSSTPGLSPLADNGGVTMTMALLANSVALDAGADPVANFGGNGYDQRGTPWLRVYNGQSDIGAFELQPDPTPPTTTTTSTSTSTSTTVTPSTTTEATDETVIPAFTG